MKPGPLPSRTRKDVLNIGDYPSRNSFETDFALIKSNKTIHHRLCQCYWPASTAWGTLYGFQRMGGRTVLFLARGLETSSPSKVLGSVSGFLSLHQCQNQVLVSRSRDTVVNPATGQGSVQTTLEEFVMTSKPPTMGKSSGVHDHPVNRDAIQLPIVEYTPFKRYPQDILVA